MAEGVWIKGEGKTVFLGTPVFWYSRQGLLCCDADSVAIGYQPFGGLCYLEFL